MTTGRINQVTISSYLETKDNCVEQASYASVIFKNYLQQITLKQIYISQSAQSEHFYKIVSK